MQRIPVKFIVQIDDFRLSELIYYWNHFNRPCSLLLQKPKSERLATVKLVVDNDEAAEFLLRAKEKTGCRLYRID